MKSAREEMQELLAGIDTPDPGMPIRNAVAENPRLVEAIEFVLDGIRDKKIHLTLRHIYESGMREKFDGPRAIDTVKTFIRLYLKRDFRTGEPL